ncbi:MAG: hypothetical protein AB2L09_08250 [Coriobacteriia bacterium]
MLFPVGIAYLLLRQVSWSRWVGGAWFCLFGLADCVICVLMWRIFLEIDPVTFSSLFLLAPFAVPGVVKVVSGGTLLLHPGIRKYFGKEKGIL